MTQAAKLILLLSITGVLLLSCARMLSTSIPPINVPEGEGFAIYLTAGDIPVTQMEALSHVELKDEPLISAVDIASYDWIKHEIWLSETGKEKLADFQVPISGKSFMICVDKAPLYWGAFYNSLSSYYPFGTPVINIYPWNGNSLVIEWSLVSGDVEAPSDPRSESMIFESLHKWGKLTW